MKKIIKILIIASLIISITIKVKANETTNNNITDYVGTIMWKWYGNDWSTGKLPKVEVDDSLIEGIDFKRSWAFTRNIVNEVTDLTYYEEDEALNKEQYPGSVCEKIDGIGKYNSSDVICHTVYGYSHIRVDDKEKMESEEDPIFTYKITNYNNLEDDLSNYINVTIEREEGEKPGEYILTPKFELKDKNSITVSFINDSNRGSIQYVFKNIGRIIVEPVSAKLIIKEKNEATIKEENNEQMLLAPHTDINIK